MKLDVLIANAGVGHFASIEDLTAEDWKTTIDTNLTGVFHSVKASIDALKQSKGYIITIASLAGTNFFAKRFCIQCQQIWFSRLYSGYHARPSATWH